MCTEKAKVAEGSLISNKQYELVAYIGFADGNEEESKNKLKLESERAKLDNKSNDFTFLIKKLSFGTIRKDLESNIILFFLIKKENFNGTAQN